MGRSSNSERCGCGQHDGGRSSRDAVFAQYLVGERAIYTAVTSRWKYTFSAGDNREFLFDRVYDPRETRDRAGVAFCAEALRAMRERMIAHLRATGHTDPLDGDNFRRYPRYELPANPDAGLLVQDPPDAEFHIPGYSDEGIGGWGGPA
ncbi:MAG: hypothetical protein ACODAQ_10665 [Phycisphaeraceae bacterium]